jgi:hypothetical protein
MPTVSDDVFISPLEQIKKTCERLGIKPSERVLLVRIAGQTLQLYRNNSLVQSYAVSTSRRPPCNVKNSFGTPRGLHQIAERIGAGQPPGMVFKGRVPTGRHYSEFPPAEQTKNLITTRILWLQGLEPGINQGGDVDTKDRFIYIHGTNHEDKVGQPQSAGCVQMRNVDIVELYEQVRASDLVYITD